MIHAAKKTISKLEENFFFFHLNHILRLFLLLDYKRFYKIPSLVQCFPFYEYLISTKSLV